MVPDPVVVASRTSSQLLLSVVIVCYNNAGWLRACLGSLFAQLAELAGPTEVILVDNQSQDASLALVEAEFPAVRVIANQENAGFARANNQGFTLCKGEFILLLNTDTEFHNGLHAMVELLQNRPEVGAVGAVMVDGRGAPRDSWGYFPTLGRMAITMCMLDRLPWIYPWFHPLIVRPTHAEFWAKRSEAHAAEWISGACILTRASVLQAVGGLDPDFFMYNEEIEWCYRLWRAGYEVWVTPAAQVTHWGAGGNERRNWKGAAAALHAYRGFLLFGRKHAPRWQLPLLRLVLSAGALLRMAAGLVLYVTARDLGARRQAREVMGAYSRVLGTVWGEVT
jgi:GT2 family glycosyltransferase